MISSTQEEWDKFWNIYTKEDDAAELSRMRSGLAAPHNSDILKKYVCGVMITSTKIPEVLHVPPR